MSVKAFYEHMQDIDPLSHEFVVLVEGVSDAPTLIGYAREHGIELSEEEAVSIVESNRRALQAGDIGLDAESRLSGDEIEAVVGGLISEAQVSLQNGKPGRAALKVGISTNTAKLLERTVNARLLDRE